MGCNWALLVLRGAIALSPYPGSKSIAIWAAKFLYLSFPRQGELVAAQWSVNLEEDTGTKGRGDAGKPDRGLVGALIARMVASHSPRLVHFLGQS
ncbi:hypothetical protein B4U84_28645 [Westiellopsis prolifica IICB1]|nr:hypothetical protein B4U84_28645 [Westiellopsis prolifica IICB1]